MTAVDERGSFGKVLGQVSEYRYFIFIYQQTNDKFSNKFHCSQFNTNGLKFCMITILVNWY